MVHSFLLRGPSAFPGVSYSQFLNLLGHLGHLVLEVLGSTIPGPGLPIFPETDIKRGFYLSRSKIRRAVRHLRLSPKSIEDLYSGTRSSFSHGLEYFEERGNSLGNHLKLRPRVRSVHLMVGLVLGYGASIPFRVFELFGFDSLVYQFFLPWWFLMLSGWGMLGRPVQGGNRGTRV
ncbi:hypothetical protein Q3G72_000534 [Acer saccharum]|nr:hypothetical protein Q3G72_000534 [Acer saccharum]